MLAEKRLWGEGKTIERRVSLSQIVSAEGFTPGPCRHSWRHVPVARRILGGCFTCFRQQSVGARHAVPWEPHGAIRASPAAQASHYGKLTRTGPRPPTMTTKPKPAISPRALAYAIGLLGSFATYLLPVLGRHFTHRPWGPLLLEEIDRYPAGGAEGWFAGDLTLALVLQAAAALLLYRLVRRPGWLAIMAVVASIPTFIVSGYALHSRLPHILWLAGPPAA